MSGQDFWHVAEFARIRGPLVRPEFWRIRLQPGRQDFRPESWRIRLQPGRQDFWPDTAGSRDLGPSPIG
jgi:hypothetical protein